MAQPPAEGRVAAGRALRVLRGPWALRRAGGCCLSPARSALETPRLAPAPNGGVTKLATEREEGGLVVAASLPRAVVSERSRSRGGYPLRRLLGEDSEWDRNRRRRKERQRRERLHGFRQVVVLLQSPGCAGCFAGD